MLSEQNKATAAISEELSRLLWERFSPAHETDFDPTASGEYGLVANEIITMVQARSQDSPTASGEGWRARVEEILERYADEQSMPRSQDDDVSPVWTLDGAVDAIAAAMRQTDSAGSLGIENEGLRAAQDHAPSAGVRLEGE